MPDPKLAGNMIGAWQQRADDALAFLRHAAKAPALFKPEAVEQARRDYAHAVQEMGRWSA
jgi:hypothetical protein